MWNRKLHFINPLFVILASVLLVTCATPPVKPPQTILPLPEGAEPLIQAKLGEIEINTRMLPKANPVYQSEVGGPFIDGIRTFLASPGLFKDSAKDVINVQSKILYLRNIGDGWVASRSVEATVKYEFRMEGGTSILEEEITSSGSDNSADLYSRSRNGAIISLSANIAQLSEVVKKKLPKALKSYTEKQEAHRQLRQKVSANMKKEDRYFRVIGSKAIIRAVPDADAKEVAKLSHSDLVYVTGSLPSGWFQVSREGKPIGWVHSSLLREDFVSSPSYGPVKPQKVTLAPDTAQATQTDVVTSTLDFGTYHALVIGNNDYRHLPKLRTAMNDAKAMAVLLQEKYGFELRLLLNATRADILRTINGYRRTLGQRDNLLIYYAGHGWLDEDADQGYWLPVDATGQDPTNWISNGSITDALRAMEAKHVLVIADSCYSGKLARGINVRIKTKNYYEKISRKKARTVMASGGLEPVADEGGKGIHSAFASALIDALNENNNIIDATLLFSQIRRPVMLNSDQTPEYSDIRKAGHAGGDFLFVKQKR